METEEKPGTPGANDLPAGVRNEAPDGPLEEGVTVDSEPEADSNMMTMSELYASMMPSLEGMPGGAWAAYQPYVSVIVPMRNEEGFASRCLQALAAQDYPRERYEVIVVDGESTDGTAKEVREMVLAYGLPDIFKTNPKQTTAAGLNIGLQVCGGEIIIRVDGHTRVDPGFISNSVKKLMETGADAVGGPIRTRGHGVVGRAIALAMESPFGVGDASFRHAQSSSEDAKDRWVESVPFAAYPRQVFSQIGFFDEELVGGEDDEFNYRLRDNGGRILMSPEVKSVYFSRGTLQELLRQYWNYGNAKAEVLRRHPKRISPRHAVPSALIVALAAGPTLGLFSRRIARLSALSAVTYAAASAFFSWQIGKDGNRQEMKYLPLAFGAMHFGAGAGMLAGLWRIISSKAKKPDTE